jgi:hypothetical protein
MVRDDLVIVSFHAFFSFSKERTEANTPQPGRNHKPPHQNPSKRPIDLLQLALQLPDRHDYATCLCKPSVENVLNLRCG